MEARTSDIHTYYQMKSPGFLELENRVIKAWDKLPIPAGYQAVGAGKEGSDEFGTVVRKYRDKHWKQIVDSDISSYYGSISLMASNEGKAYYVAAHMVKFLRLSRRLADEGDAGRTRWTIDQAVMNLDHVVSVVRSVVDSDNVSKFFNTDQASILNDFFAMIRDAFSEHLSDVSEL